jgi:DNA repair protein SbcD/Mre11
MSSRPLRFIQAGDFLLHQPLSGLMDVPEHLALRLIEAPYQAAERVFEAALAAEVEFVLLTGNLCDPHRAGPRGFVFLHQQFSRLAERDIAVYWATGATDGQQDWPAHLHWPAGVHILAPNRVEHLTHHRDGKPICQIAGRSSDRPPSIAAPLAAAAFAPNTDGLFSIAIVPGSIPFEADELAAIGNHYWAFGGSPQAATKLAEDGRRCVVHCAGTPQGRSPRDLGAFGCTLVEVADGANTGDQDQIRLTPIPTDVVRWHEEPIVLPSPIERAELEHRLHERMQSLIAAAAGGSGGIRETSALLIRWHIEGSHTAGESLNQSGLAAELLAMLRTEYGFRETPAWSVSLTTAPPELPASWSGQQTLLGEFLRRLRELESPSAAGPELDCFLSQGQLTGAIAGRVSLVDPMARTGVLRQAANLGAELLSSGAAQRDAAAPGDLSWAKGASGR